LLQLLAGQLKPAQAQQLTIRAAALRVHIVVANRRSHLIIGVLPYIR
jgi:ribosomal protein S3